MSKYPTGYLLIIATLPSEAALPNELYPTGYLLIIATLPIEAGLPNE
jgi:hypothetical protein